MDNNTPGQNNPNPYAPPSANVYEENQAFGNTTSFIPEGRKIPAGMATYVYGQAWDAFKQQPWLWIACSLIFILLSMLTGCIPVGGQVLAALLLGGFMITCARFEETGVIEIGDLFAAFQTHGSQLAIFGLIQAAFVYVIYGPFFVIDLVLELTNSSGQHVGLITTVKILSGLTQLIGLVIMGLSNFAGPALIVFHNLKPFDAFKTSISAWCKNWTFGLMFWLLSVVFAIAGMLTCCLGFLVSIPICLIASFMTYRMIFLTSNRQSF